MDPTQRIAAAVALLFLLVAGTASDAAAQSCTLGTAENTLNVNNVRAQVFNTGSLFFGGSTTNGDGYYVPKAALRSPIFASGIWIGGQRDGQLRFAGSRYTDFNFWPGPLAPGTGLPVNPASCAAFDRIYSVSRADISAYRGGDPASQDLAGWPVQYGAPYYVDANNDGTRNSDEPTIIREADDPGYGATGPALNLAAGEYPDIVGDQAVWWVMNDAGQETHAGSGTGPLGVEVQVLAFAFSRADALGNTTFYKYRVVNRGPTAITQTYITIFSDPDLGFASDDYVGYDSNLGLGYVYNADNNDEGATGYGVPPAAGYDFFQGPITPEGDTLAASAFSYFINGGPPTSTGDPFLAPIMYNFQQGLWGDGTPMRAAGNGYDQPNTFPITKFAFPGNPVTGQAWSEINNGTATPLNPPGDRRLLISTGPFNLEPGVPQDIVFGLVFAQGSSNLNSITALRAADQLAQTAYNINFQLAPPPPPPPLCTEPTSGSGRCAEAVAQNGQVTLVWGYPTTSSNYLGRFQVVDALLDGQPNISDDTYDFEGFNIYRYPTSAFQTDQRELIATFDKVNGVTTVIDLVFDPDLGEARPTVVARGRDNGLQYSLVLEGLTNYTDYFYGITAYSYNAESIPKVIESSATQIVARPAGLTSGVQVRSVNGDSLAVTPITQVGVGEVDVVVVDPTRITGDTYEVRFINPLDANGNPLTRQVTYNIVNTTTGATVLDGQAYFDQTGLLYPTGRNVAVVDGFTFSVIAPDPAFTNFSVTANTSGVLTPPAPGAFADAGFPTPGNANPGTRQQSTNPNEWSFFTGGSGRSTLADFIARATRDGGNFPVIGAFDYEMRFTGSSLAAVRGIFAQDTTDVTVPFELWRTGIGTPDDPSDDVRLIPLLLDGQGGIPDHEYGIVRDSAGTGVIAPLDSDLSPDDDDPYTDWVYWYTPVDISPGQAGYNAYVASRLADDTDDSQIDEEVLARTVLVSVNGTARVRRTPLPETGTVFRIETEKPLAAGSVFSINTANFRRTEATDDTRRAALDLIQIVPNPYLGASTYESGNASRVARFTNLPEQAATVRVYTVAGTLVKTLRKDGIARSLDWDLTTQNNLPVASGMYLIHVEIEGVGERVLKFGVVQRRTEINVF